MGPGYLLFTLFVGWIHFTPWIKPHCSSARPLLRRSTVDTMHYTIRRAFRRHRLPRCFIVCCLAVCLVTIYALSSGTMENITIDTTTEIPQTTKVFKEENYNTFIIPRNFTASQEHSVFILGVVAKNSTPAAQWDTYSVYGQWYNHDSVIVDGLRCCFKFINGTVLQKKVHKYYAHDYIHPMYDASLVMWHITCVNTDKAALPEYVTISRGSKCKSKHVAYVRPYFTQRQSPEHLVITTKLAYGTVKAEFVVSFLEAMRHFGVDKVITYVHESLDPKIRKILLYYASIGLLEYYQLQLADYFVRPRVYELLEQQYMNDEWLVKRDAIERSAGSEYFGIFDMDEFLIPSRNRSWKQLLRDLRERVSIASHFFFKNVHYLTDVEQCDESDPECSFFKKHIMMAPDMYNGRHEKSISIISRVHTYSINNHYIGSKRPYTRSTCPETEAYIRHYGACSRKFFLPHLCANSSLVKDTSMREWAERTLRHKIKDAFRNIDMF